MTADGVILLVEDNEDDAELTLRSFKAAGISNAIIRVRDGVEALDYLFGRGAYSQRDPRDLPAVVVLDLNLPKINGLDVLTEIRATAHMKHVPVVILTSSDEERDRLSAYKQFANSYLCKPVDYDRFTEAARELGLYWLRLNRPAPRNVV